MAEMDMGLAPQGKKNGKKKKKRKKQSLWNSIVTGLFPCKGDSTNEILRKIVFLAALVVLIVAVVLIAAHYLQYSRLNSHMAVDENGNLLATESYIVDLKNKTPTQEQIQQLPQGTINEEYASLYNENKDFIGWLNVPGTNIDYPVMQTDNNDDYLHTNFNKEYEFSGTLFADYRGKIGPGEMPHNTVIYGHNMLYKFQFSALINFKRDINFLKLSPVIDFNTLYNNNKYKIISVFVANISTEHGEVFDYTGANYFNNRAEFYDFILECGDRSFYDMGVDVEYGDEFLTLSTCDQDYGGLDLRLVVVARKVRPNENPEVDVERITEKDSVKFFETFYEIYGQRWYGRTWDTSLVSGLDEYIAENGLEDRPEDYEY